MTRAEGRKVIISVLFEKTFHEEPLDKIIENAAVARGTKTNDFVLSTVHGVFSHMDKLDEIIEKHLVDWRLDRLPRVTLTILRLAIYEMMYMEEIPIGASINEAVELAKEYAGDDDPSYINGVLGSIAKTIKDDGNDGK